MSALVAEEAFLFEGFRLDRRGGGLSRRDERGVFVPVPIGSRAFEVLGVLVARAGELVSRDEIIAAVWPATVVEDNNLNIQISALRRVLDEGRANGSCIQTIPGRGYRFVAPAMQRDAGVPITGSASTSTGAPVTAAAVLSIGPSPSAASIKPPSRKNFRSRQHIIAGIIGALLFVAAWLAGWHLRSSGSDETRPAPRLSIVVLPFADLSAERDQQYFTDGVTEDLTTDLSRMSGTLVISADTALTYRNKPVDAKQIGRELGVRYVVEGSLERSVNRVRVNAQLIDAASDTHLWAERFDREISDLFALQTEITGRIAFTLNLELLAAEASRRVEHPDALDYILRGRATQLNKSADADAKAINMFERALTVDPGSAEAKIRLALALSFRVLSNRSTSRTSDVMRAEALIDQGLAASPRSHLVHYAKAQLLRAQHRCAEAIPEFEMIVASDGNSAAAYAALGDCKLSEGSIDETIPLEEKAIQLSPRDPAIGIWYWRIGVVHLLQSRTDEAVHWLEKATVTLPGYPIHHAWLAAALALKGETKRGAAELAEARRLSDGRYSSIARLKAIGHVGVPKVRALFEATYFAGLRKAGMPEE